MKKHNIALHLELTPEERSYLDKSLDDCCFYDSSSSQFNSCEVAFGNPSPQWIKNNTNLKWVQLESVGFEDYLNLDTQHRVKISNLGGFFADTVAESALAGILCHYRGLNKQLQLQQHKCWIGDPLRLQMKSLKNSCVLLFGYGSINRRLHQLLTPFNCDIISLRSDWQDTELSKALAVADIVVAVVPETPKTINLFNANYFAQFKNGALFVNFGRGSAVVEDDLIEALETGHLAGAVLDVTQNEPLNKDHKFWNRDNVIITQHTGGGSFDEAYKKIDFFNANYTNYRNDKQLFSVIDFGKSY